jgi:hypothetical protein
MACDLENAYLNAPCVEKIWFEGGLECGSDKGKVCVVVCALYSLKSEDGMLYSGGKQCHVHQMIKHYLEVMHCCTSKHKKFHT